MSPNAVLGLGLAVCGVVVVIALVTARFFKSEPPPPPPPPPPTAEATVTGQLRYTEGFYKAQLEDDAKLYGIPKVDPQAIAQPLAYANELEAPRTLKSEHDGFETPHLKLAAHTIKEWATTGNGQGFKYEHLVLEITNRSDKPLAYRVETSVDHPEKCKTKGSIPHNSIALKPGETLRRTECLWHPGMTMRVNGVEVLELHDLGYYYVSRLQPTQVLLDERTATGHVVPKGNLCSFVPWREIQTASDTKLAGWGDVMDFYARHNCDEYSFFRGYKRWTSPGTLPAHGGGEATAPAAAAQPKQPG